MHCVNKQQKTTTLPLALQTLLEETRPLRKETLTIAEKNSELLEYARDEIAKMEKEDALAFVLEIFSDLFDEHNEYVHTSLFLDGLRYMLEVGACDNSQAYKAVCTLAMMMTKKQAEPLNLLCSFVMHNIGVEGLKGWSCYEGCRDIGLSDEDVVGSTKLMNRIEDLDSNNPRHLVHAGLVWGANEMVVCGRMEEDEALEVLASKGLFRLKWEGWRREYLVY